jgi:hypothetical protein
VDASARTLADVERENVKLRTLIHGILYTYDEAPTAIQWHDIRIELNTLLAELEA